MKAKLRRVLNVYSCRNGNVGYCQGMNFIVATFLDYCSEQESYFLLEKFIEMAPDYYTYFNTLSFLFLSFLFVHLLSDNLIGLQPYSLKSLSAFLLSIFYHKNFSRHVIHKNIMDKLCQPALFKFCQNLLPPLLRHLSMT